MDYYAVDSLNETLHNLRPLNTKSYIKIKNSNSNTRGCNEVSENKTDHKTYAKDLVLPKLSDIESSTSLILKKTKERDIVEKYSFLSYASLLQNDNFVLKNEFSKQDETESKPSIKVTVIPKSVYTQTRNQKYLKEKIQNTESSHQNYFRTKNVYLVVVGRKKEKIYELKTTDSTKIPAEKLHIVDNKEISIQRVSNIHHFINSLNMEKKKKKDKNSNKNQERKSKTIDENDDRPHNCTCMEADTAKNNNNDIKTHKSRVRITGRLGLTEDDKYVLKCSATVNDEPVLTNFSDVKHSITPTIRTDSHEDKQKTIKYAMPGCVSNCVNTNNRKESQATQVDFTSHTPRSDQIIQCNCSIFDDPIDIADVVEPMMGDDQKNVKDSQSLVVVISVYPKQEDEKDRSGKNFTNDHKRYVSPLRNIFNTDVVQQQRITLGNSRKDNFKKGSTKPPSRAHSPPVKMASKYNKSYEKQVETNKNPNNKKDYIGNRNVTTLTKSIPQRNKSPLSKNKEAFSKNNKIVTEAKLDIGKRLDVNASKPTKTFEVKGTNTDQILARQILIDDFMNNSMARYNPRNMISNGAKYNKRDISNISVNINGEHEYYDIQHRQGTLSTELKVRKTVKQDQNIRTQDEDSSPSMENFLPMPDAEEKRSRNRSFSQTILDAVTAQTDKSALDKITSKLNVRDSLEISHKRDNKPSSGIKNVHTSYTNDSSYHKNNNTDFYAPVKHYRGDKCFVSDPFERDKEIRELLGVTKATGNAQNFSNEACCYSSRFMDSEREIFPTKINTYRANVKRRHKKISVDVISKTISKKSTFTQTNNIEQPQMKRNRHSIKPLVQLQHAPIILTRKQYDKMKKTLQTKLSKKRCCKRCSIVSVGEVRKKTIQDLALHYNRETQTEIIELKCKEIQETALCCENASQNSDDKAMLDDLVSPMTIETKINDDIDNSQNVETDKQIILYDEDLNLNSTKINKSSNKICKKQTSKVTVRQQVENGTQYYLTKDGNVRNVSLPSRQTVSSVEVHYASIAYKQVTFSSSIIGDHRLNTTQKEKELVVGDTKSMHTIFKRQNKRLSPNLGTSAFSLCSEVNVFSDLKQAQNERSKKPFLRRLISCLVMRSTKDLEAKIDKRPAAKPRSVDSIGSLDSYHINTSLCAMEMSSSLYDTSASFFSNHTIYPVNSKIKKGFLSSVRGLLSIRKP